MMKTDEFTLRYLIGNSTLTVSRPNFVLVEIAAPFGPKQAIRILEVLEQISMECGRCYVLVDVSKFDVLSADTREAASKHANVDAFAAMALVGASFPMRVAIGMLFRAVRALSKIPYDYPFAFFQTRTDACAWLKKQASEGHGSNVVAHPTIHRDWLC